MLLFGILTAALSVIVFANIVICMIVVMGGDDMRGAAMGGCRDDELYRNAKGNFSL